MKKVLALLCVVLLWTGCNKNEDPEVYLTLDFESVPESSLAGPTAYGENLYTSYEGTSFSSYHDPETDLVVALNGTEYYEGGIAVSQWNDMEGDDYKNQCSVYYKDTKTGYGGTNGSKTFGVVNGYEGEFTSCPEIYFKSTSTEKVFDHFWIANSTHAFLTMKNGNNWSKVFSHADKDWFKLTVYGYDRNGEQTGKVEFYLADFRTEDSPGILTGWSKINLSSLGAVNKLVFELESSDTGEEGINTPAYFCIDNITVKE